MAGVTVAVLPGIEMGVPNTGPNGTHVQATIMKKTVSHVFAGALRDGSARPILEHALLISVAAYVDPNRSYPISRLLACWREAPDNTANGMPTRGKRVLAFVLREKRPHPGGKWAEQATHLCEGSSPEYVAPGWGEGVRTCYETGAGRSALGRSWDASAARGAEKPRPSPVPTVPAEQVVHDASRLQKRIAQGGLESSVRPNRCPSRPG